MKVVSTRRGAAVLLLLMAHLYGAGQGPQSSEALSRVVYVTLQVESSVDVPGVSDPFITAPVVCGADGAIFVRTATVNAVSDLIAVSRDGKSTTSFGVSKITDILNPSLTTFFVRDSDAYLLVRGSTAEGRTLTLHRPDGSAENQPAYSSRQYIAHFRADGTYLGAVALDVPIRPLQIGTFPNGDFLIAGTTMDMRETRVALVKANGQFDRFLELTDDIRLQSESGPETPPSAASLPQTGKHFGESFFEATQVSAIIADGRNLLLVRKGQKVPVFSVSPAGQVEAVHLDVPDGYGLWDIKTTRAFWVALYTHRLPEGKGVEFSSMALDPKTGKALERYSYTRFPGFGLACTDGIEFSFLIREDNKLKILKLISSHVSSSAEN